MSDSDISAQSVVNVVDPAKLAHVKEALTSHISGTSVYRGQTVTLSCETEGATIYYTTDGSCPCDESSRIKYDGKPVAINGDLSLKIRALPEKNAVVSGNMSRVRSSFRLFVFTAALHAQGSGWTVNPYDYQYDMTVYAKVAFDDVDVTTDGNFEIAAFVNDECLGIASPETQGGYYTIGDIDDNGKINVIDVQKLVAIVRKK